MRTNYLVTKETVTECPICGKLLLEGPGMSRKDKAIRRLKKLPDYKNIFKHILNHSQETADSARAWASPPKWKKMTQEQQATWIVNKAKEYLASLEVE